jgi:choline-glycine betaine transporter
MSKLQDEVYTSHKAEYIIIVAAAATIGFLWKFLPDILPFVGATQIQLMYLIKAVSCLLVMLIALGSYIIYLRRNPKYNALKQAQHEDLQRKKLGAFVLDELERLKKEHRELQQKPRPTSGEVFAQMREHGKFLEGQDEMLMRISKYILPPVE